jgi:hypothetical protein
LGYFFLVSIEIGNKEAFGNVLGVMIKKLSAIHNYSFNNLIHFPGLITFPSWACYLESGPKQPETGPFQAASGWNLDQQPANKAYFSEGHLSALRRAGVCPYGIINAFGLSCISCKIYMSCRRR